MEPYNGGTLITSYKIESNMGEGSTFLQIGTTGGQTTSYQVLDLVTSQTYEFRIIAVNDVGESIASVPTPLDIATIPSQPGTVEKVLSTLSSITIKWAEPVSDGGAAI